MKAAAKYLSIVLVISALGILLMSGWAIWYRSTDHTGRLLAASAGMVKTRESVLPDSAGMRRVVFQLFDDRGRTSNGILQIPRAAEGPLPAVLILGGHGTGARAVELVKLSQPAVLCGLDYPEIPEYRVGLLRVPDLLQTLDSLVLDAAAMAFTALDYLDSRPEVDCTRLTVLGASFGVPFAVIAGLDEHVDGMALLYGGAGLDRIIEHNLRRKIKQWWIRKPLAFLLGTIAAPYEPGGYVDRFAPRPLLVVNGTEDARMPDVSARALYEAAGEPKKRVLLPGSHLHPSNTALIDSLTATVSTWMDRAGLM